MLVGWVHLFFFYAYEFIYLFFSRAFACVFVRICEFELVLVCLCVCMRACVFVWEHSCVCSVARLYLIQSVRSIPRNSTFQARSLERSAGGCTLLTWWYACQKKKSQFYIHATHKNNRHMFKRVRTCVHTHMCINKPTYLNKHRASASSGLETIKFESGRAAGMYRQQCLHQPRLCLWEDGMRGRAQQRSGAPAVRQHREIDHLLCWRVWHTLV